MRRRRGEASSRGQSLVEFTLAIPLFMLVVLGIAEGSYYVVATTIVSHATQEGARYGVLDSTSSRAAIRAHVTQAAAPVVTLSSSQIKLKLDHGDCSNDCYQGRKEGQTLTVETTYDHTPLVSYIFNSVSIPASTRAELTVERDPS